MNRDEVPAAIKKLALRAAAGKDRDPRHHELSLLVSEAEDEARRIRAMAAGPMAIAFAEELEAAVAYARNTVWPKKPSPPDDAA